MLEGGSGVGGEVGAGQPIRKKRKKLDGTLERKRSVTTWRGCGWGNFCWMGCGGETTFFSHPTLRPTFSVQCGEILYQVISREFNETCSRNAYLISLQNQISIRYYKLPIYKTQRYFEMINERISIRYRGNASFHLWNENRRAMDRAD